MLSITYIERLGPFFKVFGNKEERGVQFCQQIGIKIADMAGELNWIIIQLNYLLEKVADIFYERPRSMLMVYFRSIRD